MVKSEIDVQNLVINQILWPDEVVASKLLVARMKMQQKYISQFLDLYEDMHVVQCPLLADEVRGVGALKAFSANLVEPYKPPPPKPGNELEKEVLRLRKENEELKRALNSWGQ